MKPATESVFDIPEALRIVEARQAAVRPLLQDLQKTHRLRSVADVGCGVGYFSSFLQDMGFDVVGSDGRRENVDEAKNRYPQISFHQANVESESILSLGSFDLVFCMGLLYHLENPLLAIRRLRALSATFLLVESMCIPEESPWMSLREEPRADNQSLTDVAFYPTEGCLVKMLFRAGYSYVYRLAALPDHDDFRETATRRRRRTVLFASSVPVNNAQIVPLSEPHAVADPWLKPVPPPPLVQRASSFLRKPANEKAKSFYLRWSRFFPRVPAPFRLQFGAWWMLRNDAMGNLIRQGNFEPAEISFVSRFLKPGMTVLDIGAHHGMYSLLASKRVGPLGKVFAFEPSPRERKALILHLRLNGCSNVSVQALAVGERNSSAEFFVADANDAGCNSLRHPGVDAGLTQIAVQIARLDDWILEQKIGDVDFIKLDVEGGELSVLRGATRLLSGGLRPVILAEVQDVRTLQWGYRAKEIVEFMEQNAYRWFALSEDGFPRPLDTNRAELEDNLIACPEERLETLKTSVLTTP